MIARQWKGYSEAGKADAYLAHLRGNVLPQLKALDGFRGVSLAKRRVGDEVELLVTTRWASMSAIRAFAGDTPETAVVEPEAIAVLTRYDDTVAHYEVMLDA